MAVPGKEAVSKGNMMEYDGIIPLDFYESSILEKLDKEREWLSISVLNLKSTMESTLRMQMFGKLCGLQI